MTKFLTTKTKTAATGVAVGVTLYFVGKTLLEIGGAILVATSVLGVSYFAAKELKRGIKVVT